MPERNIKILEKQYNYFAWGQYMGQQRYTLNAASIMYICILINFTF